MNIDSILAAIERVDGDRDKINTLANGSHMDIEGSTGESIFPIITSTGTGG